MKTTIRNILVFFILFFSFFLSIGVSIGSSPEKLKDAFNGKFLFGVALNTDQVEGIDTLAQPIIKEHFNSIVAENCMKSEKIQPRQGVFTFSDADKFVTYGEANKMFIIGHCLIWHSQTPDWFFVDNKGNYVSRDTLIARMKTHIQTLVGRYKGRVNGWDVVNEAFEDDGKWRQSKFYKIIGEEYIELAFRFAGEADPEAELYYNDYSMAKPGRRDAVIQLVNKLKGKNIRIDAIGMQGHITLDYPALSDFEKSIVAFSKSGVQVMVTELDVTVLPNPFENVTANVAENFEYREKMDPYKQQLPDSVNQVFTNRYVDLFKLLLKHHEKISRVTIWGVSDGQSWRNYWPIYKRTDYPLLFDRNYEPKPVVAKLVHASKFSR